MPATLEPITLLDAAYEAEQYSSGAFGNAEAELHQCRAGILQAVLTAELCVSTSQTDGNRRIASTLLVAVDHRAFTLPRRDPSELLSHRLPRAILKVLDKMVLAGLLELPYRELPTRCEAGTFIVPTCLLLGVLPEANFGPLLTKEAV